MLIIRGGALGDFILTLPAFAALRTAFPAARIETIACPRIASLALASGLADAVRPIESRALAGFFAEAGTLDPEWVDYFSHFDLIVNYLFDPAGVFRCNISSCTNARWLSAPHRPLDSSPHYAARQLIEPLATLCPIKLDAHPSIQLPAQQAVRSVTPQVMLHPGSGSPAKNWPLERWAELLRRIVNETGWHPTLFAGEAEGWQVDRLHALLPPGQATLARNWPLPEVARTLCQATLFIGHDSGITHLAAACNAPVLALWGPTVRQVWAPRGPKVTVLADPEGLDHLPVETVFETAKTLVAECAAPNTLSPE